MKIPFVTFKPLEKELNTELRDAFERVYHRSWYIEGEEDIITELAGCKVLMVPFMSITYYHYSLHICCLLQILKYIFKQRLGNSYIYTA